MKATWHGQVIAQSNDTLMIEGRQYFPPSSVKKEFLKDSDTQYHCHWKGDAKYYHIEVDGEMLKDGAWCYPQPPQSAINLVGTDFSNYVAFDPQVDVA